MGVRVCMYDWRGGGVLTSVPASMSLHVVQVVDTLKATDTEELLDGHVILDVSRHLAAIPERLGADRALIRPLSSLLDYKGKNKDD